MGMKKRKTGSRNVASIRAGEDNKLNLDDDQKQRKLFSIKTALAIMRKQQRASNACSDSWQHVISPSMPFLD